jgi:hypothetical protein
MNCTFERSNNSNKCSDQHHLKNIFLVKNTSFTHSVGGDLVAVVTLHKIMFSPYLEVINCIRQVRRGASLVQRMNTRETPNKKFKKLNVQKKN